MMAIAALASCSKDDVVNSQEGEAIAFGNVFVDNSTRAAADPSYSANDITSLVVYGTVNNVVIYPGTPVTKGDAAYGAAWTCDVKQYWVPGANYKFVGIVDGAESDITLNGGMPTAISYTADGVTDLLCQTITKTANTDGTANGLVAFNFTHLLSKAKFTVTNSTSGATQYLHVVRDIKISNAYKAATYDVTNATWINPDDSGEGQEFDDITASAETTECANEKLLIPGLKSVTVEFVVDLYYGSVADENLISSTEYTKSATVTIEAAKAYNFNITVGVGEVIQFTVTQKPTWTDVTPATGL